MIVLSGHHKELLKLMFHALALHQSDGQTRAKRLYSDEGLTCKISALEALCSCQLILSIQFIKPNNLVILTPASPEP